jgi:hypothetical protein
VKSGFSMRSSQVIARSLKITRTTHSLVAAITAAVALNSMVAIQYLGLSGQAALLVVVFVSLGVGSLAVSTDIYSRSSQTLTNLRSIGATTGSISSALALAIVGYGIAGAVIGAGSGGALGFALGSSGAGSMSLLTDAIAVIAASSGAIAAGFYVGARATWSS